MNRSFDILSTINFVLDITGAITCVAALAWIWTRGDRTRLERGGVILALGLTALWGLASAGLGRDSFGTQALEALRNLAWVVAIYRMFQYDGHHVGVPAIRPVIFAVALLECVQAGLFTTLHYGQITPLQGQVITDMSSLLRILEAVGILMLVHNIYIGAASALRDAIRWTAAAMAVFWAFDLNYYAMAYLDMVPMPLQAIHGLIITFTAVALGVGANNDVPRKKLRASRQVTIQTLSLVAIGVYLVILTAAFKSQAIIGASNARIVVTVLIFAAGVLALIWLPSPKLRAWLRVKAFKHFFEHRYDYREEWLRFTATIGKCTEDAPSLQVRAIKAAADITDSVGGVLLVLDDQGVCDIAAQWQWDSLDENEVRAQQFDLAPLAELLARHNFILDLDELREGRNYHGERALVPDWLVNSKDAWIVVPLNHFERLLGVIILSHPSDDHKLDWEDRDLLHVITPQIASYLAEHAGQEALIEASRFDDFNRRIAFVMHDIKNLSSQLGLLARNAEVHAHKEEFRADMLVTLRNSADKLNGLLSRLNRFGSDSVGELKPISLVEVADNLVQKYKIQHPIRLLSRPTNALICADHHALEQALTHLVQNAIDASRPDDAVELDIEISPSHVSLQIIDRGTGMDNAFIQNHLFKPFVSSKNSGLGIGAYEARELIRAMGGLIKVSSGPESGTCFSCVFKRHELDPQADHMEGRAA